MGGNNSQDRSRLTKARPKDVISILGAEYRVLKATRTPTTVIVLLEDDRSRQSTLIGLPETRVSLKRHPDREKGSNPPGWPDP